MNIIKKINYYQDGGYTFSKKRPYRRLKIPLLFYKGVYFFLKELHITSNFISYFIELENELGKSIIIF